MFKNNPSIVKADLSSLLAVTGQQSSGGASKTLIQGVNGDLQEIVEQNDPPESPPYPFREESLEKKPQGILKSKDKRVKSVTKLPPNGLNARKSSISG